MKIKQLHWQQYMYNSHMSTVLGVDTDIVNSCILYRILPTWQGEGDAIKFGFRVEVNYGWTAKVVSHMEDDLVTAKKVAQTHFEKFVNTLLTNAYVCRQD